MLGNIYTWQSRLFNLSISTITTRRWAFLFALELMPWYPMCFIERYNGVLNSLQGHTSMNGCFRMCQCLKLALANLQDGATKTADAALVTSFSESGSVSSNKSSAYEEDLRGGGSCTGALTILDWLLILRPYDRFIRVLHDRSNISSAQEKPSHRPSPSGDSTLALR